MSSNLFDAFQLKFSSFVAKYKFRFLGMGFLWAWIYCCWFTPVLFPDAGGITVKSSDSWILSSVAITLTLLLGSPLLRGRDIFRCRWTHGVALFCMVGGTYAMSGSPINLVHDPFVRNGAAFATGIGSGLLWLLWANLYEKLKVEISEMAIPLSALIVPVCVLGVQVLAEPVASVVIICLPLASYLCLVLCFSEGDDLEEPGTAAPQKGFWNEFSRIGLVAALIHGVVAFVWALIPMSYLETVGGGLGLPIALGCVIAVAIMLASSNLSRYADIFTMYRWLLPVVAISLTAFAFGTFEGQFVACVFIMIAQIGYSSALYVFFARVAHAGWMSYAMGLGFSRGIAQLGVALGSYFGLQSHGLFEAGHLSVPLVCLVSLCLVMVPTLMLLNRESCFRYGATSLPLEKKSGGEPLGEEGGRSEMPSQSSSLAAEQAKGEFLGRCETVAGAAGLSAREFEVFVLFAQGRSMPYIRDVLHISKNTVDSHSKSIYRKLGIHTRQELIDLVQRPES